MRSDLSTPEKKIKRSFANSNIGSNLKPCCFKLNCVSWIACFFQISAYSLTKPRVGHPKKQDVRTKRQKMRLLKKVSEV